jgi:L-histidine N-alpha-methyltransferase
MRPGDLFLLGVDMVKSAAVLEAAYNDGAHVTEAFNRNILNVVNSLTGSDFVPEAFEHVAFYNERESRIEMHLRATRDTMVRTVRFSREFFLHKGETIHTENSHKFTEEYLDDLVSGTGLRIRHRTSDRRRWFTVLCLEKERVPA